MSLSQPTEFFQNADHPFAELYRKRVEQNRDLVVLITDSSNDRGTGKTTEALRIADGMDRTEEGLTEEKVALDPHPLTQAYVDKPRGAGLCLDETEVGMDKYRAGSGINKAIRELVSMGRVEQKYLVLNAPADHLVDKDLKTLVDVWILVERRGFARVYRMDWEPHGSHELTRSLGTVEWNAIPRSSDVYDVYEYLTEKKEARLRGEEGDEYIKRSEAQEMVEKAREEAAMAKRDDIIRNLREMEDVTQGMIADAVGLSQGRISQV